MSDYLSDNGRRVDWVFAAQLWSSGLDTKSIASLFWVHESVIYNKLDRIKSGPSKLAGAA